jgi:acetyl-CoA carboxylase biotin carboxylase subunit
MAPKVLVANRGEIAVRVMRTLREMGWGSVAVHSDPDRAAPHVRAADAAVSLGGAKALESYLDQDKIIAAAKRSGADGIHPGYGFLAENAAFAKRVEAEGLVFVGPTPENIALMGDKLEARKRVAERGVPLTPGSKEPVGPGEAAGIAAEIGFPVLIKAAAGGGGKGMRVVREPGALAEALEGAAREAKSAFSDARVYIEKYVENPRHIEFQILADATGKTLHLYERECSVQRRYQKIIEESPSTALTPELREKMAQAAVAAAKAVGYRNAGTVEFLFSHGEFYFMEMNTRIQVEHPVTEMTTGLDLVKLQLEIAFGGKLALEQGDIKPRGHAIECRIYAEDPLKNFLPSPGTVHAVREPRSPWVRVDSGIADGTEVPPLYDPILSKVITWGTDRGEARRRMVRALQDYVVLGVATPIPFLLDLIEHPAFVRGEYDTHLLPDHFADWKPHASEGEQALALAAAAALFAATAAGAARTDGGTARSGWPPVWESAGALRHGEGKR